MCEHPRPYRPQGGSRGRATIARAWVSLGSVGCGVGLARGSVLEDHQIRGTMIRGCGMVRTVYTSRVIDSTKDKVDAGQHLLGCRIVVSAPRHLSLAKGKTVAMGMSEWFIQIWIPFFSFQ